MSARVELPLTALRRFARAGGNAAGERCGVCARPVGDSHAHLFEPARGMLQCACEACAMAAPRGWKRVERKAVRLADGVIGDGLWAALGVPAGLAFFTREGETGRVVARFPGAAGAAVAVVDEGAWRAVADASAAVAAMENDLEALLVNRLAGASECYVASVDECYRLVSRVREAWRGVGGGAGVQESVRDFFAEIARGAEGAACR